MKNLEIGQKGIITFHAGGEDLWVMKIQKENGRVKVRFNTKDYPDALENDFAEGVAKILCKSGYLEGWMNWKDQEKK